MPSPQERDTQPHDQRRQCIQCHATCLKCVGPDEFHCTECQPLFAFVDDNEADALATTPSASGQEHRRRCASINGKQRHSGLSGTNKSSPNVTLSDPADSQKFDKSWQSTDYLITITVVGATLLVAFVVIYLLWRRCFRGILLGNGIGGGVGGADYQHYNRVQTDEANVDNEPSYAELVRDEIDDILAESSSDESSNFVPTRIIAPLER